MNGKKQTILASQVVNTVCLLLFLAATISNFL